MTIMECSSNEYSLFKWKLKWRMAGDDGFFRVYYCDNLTYQCVQPARPSDKHMYK